MFLFKLNNRMLGPVSMLLQKSIDVGVVLLPKSMDVDALTKCPALVITPPNPADGTTNGSTHRYSQIRIRISRPFLEPNVHIFRVATGRARWTSKMPRVNTDGLPKLAHEEVARRHQMVVSTERVGRGSVYKSIT